MVEASCKADRDTLTGLHVTWLMQGRISFRQPCRARHYIMFVFVFVLNQNIKAISQQLSLTHTGSLGS
jgi:hypothetical protein